VRTRTEPPAIRRRAILDAARGVLIKKGYGDAHLDDVAAAAGIAKGTLYLYFKDKEDLFGEVLGDLVERLMDRLRGLPPAPSAMENLRRAAAAELDFADENQDFLVQFAQQKPMLCKAQKGKALHDRFCGHLRHIAGLIEKAVAAKALRPCDSFEGGLYLVSLVRMFLMKKIFLGEKTPLREKTDALMKLFLHGLGAARP